MNLWERWHFWITNRLRAFLDVPSTQGLTTRFRNLETKITIEHGRLEQKRQELEAFAQKLKMQSADIERRYKELSKVTADMETVAGAMTLAISDSATEVSKAILLTKEEMDK